LSHDPSRSIPISRFDYDLPPELIAQQPLRERDASRLMVVTRKSSSIEDRHFFDLPDLLQPGDLLVLNDTRVIPARVFAQRESGGRVELLFLREVEDGTWVTLARPARRLKIGELLKVQLHDGSASEHACKVVDRLASGEVLVHLDDALDVLNLAGHTPLPPYVDENVDDAERYQTVYSRLPGSAAAPTAGLHFTERLLHQCSERGIEIAHVTLHVGLDTFQPVKVDNALEHQMHSEWFQVSAESIRAIREARERSARVVAVGTTVCRTLESIADHLDSQCDIESSTSMYITPGYQFRVVDSLVTNFHLPRTTLLLMVSALAGEDLIRHAYAHAIAERYRFYSFGDAMIIV
jgi:S-adenosylmethionine:tRNA ribosyltransferase-isomerase